MNMSIIAFVLMASVTVLFMAASLFSEWSFKFPALKQMGESSLGRNSVNWLGAIAFIGAIIICII